MEVVDRGGEDGTSQRPSLRLAKSDLDIFNAIPLQELENVLGAFERSVAVGAIGTDADPDCDGAGNVLAETVLSLLLPTETSEVNGSEPDLFGVEESRRLGTNVVLPELGMFVHGEKLDLAKVARWPSRWREGVLRRPID